ncbi:hypothetical protein [Parasphingorhabdus cellanae]|uniref:DUF429 domain-containing protein n=1 Tax=Parasphingorhabdus cellanae TaxID=2806553 RepID=A0ABX7T965_9SPHN|nr:hypothetical protein [Parasphingorhabdus cellanae]QTD56578.1 hypothetical protein J4G78_03000 [Parasphingorhabdus cellanae]
MRRFSHFTCVDWSGAKTERPGGIALATIGPDGPPALLSANPRWSRENVRDWLLKLALEKQDMLIGFDLSMALPFHDVGSYFPEWEASPSHATDLWQLVDTLSAVDPYLNVLSFLDHPEATRHFRHSRDHVGDLFIGGTGRLRVVEQHQRETRQANSASCFNLVGAAQVGKSSLTGMRMLHQLNGAIPVWPFDPIPDRGPMIVEIYTTIAALAAGLPKGKSKIRDRDGLEAALNALQTPLPAMLSRYDDHSTDALITAAWLKNASTDMRLWHPPMLTDEIAQKEGWTFGIF